MPFQCVQKHGKWVCENSETHESHGRHDTKAQCQAQMRALYANAKDLNRKSRGDDEIG